MIVATVLKSGGIYNTSHVEKIRDMAKKYIQEHTFVCLSDVDVPCERIPLTDGLTGWWSKMELFKLRGPVLFFDLDTIIRGDISQMLHDVVGKEFVILRDFYRKGDGMQSSMMFWDGDVSYVYEEFKRKGAAGLHGDQDFIETCVRNPVRWQDITDGVVSFKVDVLKRGLRDTDKVVIFHGDPRPWRQDVISY